MIFHEREVKPYGEPVDPNKLKIGDVRFGVQYLDDEGFVPVLEPKVFIGKNLDTGDDGEFYFQDFSSYQRGVRYGVDLPGEQAKFETGAEKHVYEFERALNVLLFCSLQRAKAGQ